MFGDENKKYQTNYTTSKEKNMQRAEKKLCSKQKRISAFSYLCAFFVREQPLLVSSCQREATGGRYRFSIFILVVE